MAFGLTTTGFILKPNETIQAELEADYKQALGSDQARVTGLGAAASLVGTQTERLGLLWQLAQTIYNSQFRDTSSGTSLDNAVSLVGISRLPARTSTVVLTLAGDSFDPTTIPINTLVQQSTVVVNWQTLVEVIIPAQTQTILTLDAPLVTGNNFNLTVNGDEIVEPFDTSNLITMQNLKATLEARVDTLSATISGGSDEIMTIVADSGFAMVVSAVSITDGASQAGITQVDNGTIEVNAETIEKGDFEAAIGTIDTIVNPIAGWRSVTNLVVGVDGRAFEEDAELRLRALTAINIARGGTAVAMKNRIFEDVAGVEFVAVRENRTGVIDIDGLAPHSVDVTVIGGTDEDVAAKILETKPVGIETNGTESEDIADDFGVLQTIKFNRATEIDIYFIANLTTTVDYPADGDTSVKTLIKDFIDDLDNGDDVINYAVASSISSIPGIIGVTILQDTSPAPAVSTDIAIAANEKAKSQLTNITVNS